MSVGCVAVGTSLPSCTLLLSNRIGRSCVLLQSRHMRGGCTKDAELRRYHHVRRAVPTGSLPLMSTAGGCARGSRIVHSPEAVQGHTALEEVCEPAPAQPSRFELVAGAAGIRHNPLRCATFRAFPSAQALTERHASPEITAALAGSATLLRAQGQAATALLILHCSGAACPAWYAAAALADFAALLRAQGQGAAPLLVLH